MRFGEQENICHTFLNIRILSDRYHCNTMILLSLMD